MTQVTQNSFDRVANFCLDKDLQNRNKDLPNYVSDVYQFMAADWEYVNDIFRGTKWVKAKGQQYLPIEPAEESIDYERRLDRSVMVPAYNQTINGLVGLMTRKHANVVDDLPDQLDPLLSNIDNNGNDINKFFQDASKNAWNDGLTYILADFPNVEGVETLEDERALELRPYLVNIKAADMLSWRYEIVNGRLVIQQIVYRSRVERQDGLFGTKIVYQYHVRTPDEVQVWEMEFDDSKKKQTPVPILVETRPITFGFIPLEIYYTNKIDDFIAEPTLLDLAEMNVKHYRVYSDYSHNLHISSVPILAIYGSEEGDAITISPNTAVKFSAANSKMEYIETSGVSLDASRMELADIEGRMAKMGLQQLAAGAENKTATQSMIDKEEGRSKLQEAVVNGEQAMNNSLQNVAAIMGIEMPEEAFISFSRDIDKMQLDSGTIAQYSNMHAKGQISLETMWQMLMDGEVLPSSFDVEAEKEKIDQEVLGLVGAEGSPEDLVPPEDEVQAQREQEEMFVNPETGELISSSGNVIPLRREG